MIRSAMTKRKQAKGPSWSEQMMQGATDDRVAAEGFEAQAGESRNRYLEMLAGGPEALNTYARAAAESARGALQGDLQGAREMAQRRGISTGDLGTSYEGDIFSAYDKNLTDSVAGQSMNMLDFQASGARDLYGMDVQQGDNRRNRYLDIISGHLDRQAANRNAKRGARSATTGAIAGGLGTIGGFVLGGPVGAAIGNRIAGKKPEER